MGITLCLAACFFPQEKLSNLKLCQKHRLTNDFFAGLLLQKNGFAASAEGVSEKMGNLEHKQAPKSPKIHSQTN